MTRKRRLGEGFLESELRFEYNLMKERRKRMQAPRR